MHSSASGDMPLYNNLLLTFLLYLNYIVLRTVEKAGTKNKTGNSALRCQGVKWDVNCPDRTESEIHRSGHPQSY